MSVVKYAVIEVDCDVCGACDRSDYWETASKAKAIKELRRDGWKIGKKCLCPKCSKKKASDA